MARLSAPQVIALIADSGTFEPWDVPGTEETGISEQYRGELLAARHSTGSSESVRTGAISIDGVPAAILAWEFGFLGGSVGVGTARVIVRAVRRATEEGRALVAVPRSGGTRMQEGAPAFLQMAAITAAIGHHRAAGLPYLVHLGHPTSGGVLATLGSLGDRTTAEPGAMVGLLGPRAVRAITGQDLPQGVQTAENLARVGVVDQVVPTELVREQWSRLLGAWADRGRAPSGPWSPPPEHQPPADADELWAGIVASRSVDRPGAPEVIDEFLADVVDLYGPLPGRTDDGVRVVVGRLEGAPVVVVATTDRRTRAPLTAVGLAAARRGLDLAGRWGLPVLAVVDTLGAELSAESEEAGIAGEVARTTLAFLEVPTTTVCLLLGPGTGGAALPMLAADRVVATASSWVGPLAPEGAAAIRPSPGVGPAGIAWQQRVGAHALADLGLVDRVVADTGPAWLADAVAASAAALADVLESPQGDRRLTRFEAWG